MPAVRALADEVRGRGKNSPQRAAEFLVSRRVELQSFPSVDVLAVYGDSEWAPPGATSDEIRSARALLHHLMLVRRGLADALWSRQIFVSVEVIDELVFFGARSDRTSDLILECLGRIRDGRMTRPGLVILPLHSFGVYGLGIRPPRTRAQLTFASASSGYALFPQTNDLARTINQLDGVARTLSVNKSIPAELLEHWYRSRDADWLERNSLLAVRISHFPGSYYSSERLILNRVGAVIGLLSLLAALQPANPDSTRRILSSLRMNNRETLDIHHYLALFDTGTHHSELAGDCVPIHRGRTEVSELVGLGFEIDPQFWGTQLRLGEGLRLAVEALYSEQLRTKLARVHVTARMRTVSRMFAALQMFRRSFIESADDWTGRVALATAFEMLLTDNYGAVQRTLVSRTRTLLRGQRGTRMMQRAVADLYASRSELVHGAEQTTTTDMHAARRAFALCFLELSGRVPNIRPLTSTPIGDIVD